MSGYNYREMQILLDSGCGAKAVEIQNAIIEDLIDALEDMIYLSGRTPDNESNKARMRVRRVLAGVKGIAPKEGLYESGALYLHAVRDEDLGITDDYMRGKLAARKRFEKSGEGVA
jgi:ElaB/YqjD/DUF883 family membrane-anchored ribosome-binding protein